MPFSKEVSLSISMLTLLLKLCQFAVDLVGNTQLVPTNLSWIVDMTAPTVNVISPAPGLRTRHDWVNVSVQGDEPLSEVLIWLPGAAIWLRSTALTVMLNTTGVGQKYALLKGGKFLDFYVYDSTKNCINLCS
jgi:hypothetical protein